MPAPARIDFDQLETFARDALMAVGVPKSGAALTATALATTDAMGVVTHGTKLLAGYLRKLIGRGYRPAGQPQIERQGPSWAIINGDSALGQIGCDFAVRLGMQKAAATGVAYIGLRNTGHIGAAGYFPSLAAREGFLVMVTGNDIPSVAAPGSRRAVLGSNPLAYAIPYPNHPILLDIATATVAGGKVYAARRRGEPIPGDWLIGEDGRPTTDAAAYPDRAALAPMAGHKGYGLGLWCEVLSAIMPGGHSTWQVGSWLFDPPSRPSWHNASFTLYHLPSLGPIEHFYERISTLAQEIHNTPTADTIDRLRLPGEFEWERLERARREGIPLPEDVIERCQEAAQLANLAPLVFHTHAN